MSHESILWSMLNEMAKQQGQFRPRKRQYFEKCFLPAYSTGFRASEKRKGKTIFFFEALLHGPLD